MNYRSLLVHLNDDPRCDARVDIAARIAINRNARLVGLAPAGVLEWYAPMAPAPFGAEELATAYQGMRARAQAHAAGFREQCASTRLEAFSAIVDEAPEASSVVRHGHGHDLIVLGQPTPSHRGARQARSLLEEVVLNASRPALVIPCAGDVETIGRTVLVAWNGSREAARAAADAMPLLISARTVHLIEFRRSVQREGAAEAGLPAAAEWLRRHGVHVQSRVETGADDVGGALMSRAADCDADLVVMGAYGHARWTERLLGGATRSVLDQMAVPVLMSH